MPKSESIAKPVNRRQRPAKRSLSKTDVEALAAFRYQLRLFALQRRCVPTPRHHAIAIPDAAANQGFSRPRMGNRERTGRAPASEAPRRCSLISRCESLGLVRRKTSTADLRQVEVHLTAQGQRVVNRLALQHRDELQTFVDYCGNALRPTPTPAPSSPPCGEQP